MAKKESSAKASSIAARVLRGDCYSHREVKTLAASVLAQDEQQGQGKQKAVKKKTAKKK